MSDQSQGLTCPNCSGVVPVPEGSRLVQCPFCQMTSLVQGERGVRRWQVRRRIDRTQALTLVKSFFTGIKKAQDLARQAEIRDVFLIYLPYWRVQATVAGWMFGREKSGKDSTRPIEVEVMQEMHWNDAAVDVSEFGVHQVTLSKTDLEPFDAEQLHSEAIVFDPAESATDALHEAEKHFVYRARRQRSLKQRFWEKFHLLRSQLSIVYYPLWVVRYAYRQRRYQIVVDGVSGKVLYGKAPGNIFYRAAALVGGMALGNLLLVNGPIVMGWVASGSDDSDSLWLVLLPIALGMGLIAWAYRSFRYGEEVEEIQAESKKAELADTADSGSWDLEGLSSLVRGQDASKWLQTGLSFVEEMAELKQK